MEFDLVGRLDNLRLPDGRTAILYSVFEAVSNSIHAIEDRFGADEIAEKGLIDISVEIDRKSKSIARITVSDNGIGLNDENLKGFNTCDGRQKKSKGGKGIGRLIWLKLFDRIQVESTYQGKKGSSERVTFEFVPDQKDTLKKLKKTSGKQHSVGTRIEFSELKVSSDAQLKRATFIRDLALHFFSYFIAESMPRLTLTFGDAEPLELREYIKDRIDEPVIEPLGVKGLIPDGQAEIVHLYVQRTISKDLKNSLLLVADKRQVERIEIEKKYALNQLPQGKAYLAIVRGKFLDDRVDQERTGFKLTKVQLDAIHEAALNKAEAFLTDHIASLRGRQREIVSALLEEHPQLAVKVRNVEQYVETLGPSMGDEDIGKTLFTLLYREERKLAKEVQRLSEMEDLDEEVKESAQATLAQVTEQARGRLAEYVVKRRQILDLAKSFLRYREGSDEVHHYEKAIHDLICPMGKFHSGGQYDAHNLWILDDLLAYYQFFASDKKIKSFATPTTDNDEPDIVFVNPMGFRREGTNEPVVIVEFKRPGDEQPSGNPVEQVLGYIEKLRDKTVTHVNGEVLSEINEATPFLCYVVCDLTAGTRKLLERSLATFETPDGFGYFGFAPNHKAAIHVVSYKKMLRDAELRNKVFFEHLGLVGT